MIATTLSAIGELLQSAAHQNGVLGPVEFDVLRPTKEFLEYSDEKHSYYADGRKRLSVTQILDKVGLISQFCKDEEARNRGSRVHALCADDDRTTLDMRTVPPMLRNYVRAWRKYRKDSGFIPELIEQRIDDSTYEYAGRFDRYGFWPTQDPLVFRDAILDIKTSVQGTVEDYVRYQLVAYAHALKPNKIFNRIAVSLKPDGGYKCRVFETKDFLADRSQWFQYVRQAKEAR